MKLFYYRHQKQSECRPLENSQIDFHELTLLLRGELEYVVDYQKFPMRSGDIIYLPQGSFRARKKHPVADYVSFNFYAEEGEKISLPTYIEKGITNEITFLLNACDEIRSQLLPDVDRLELLLNCIVKQLAVNIERSTHSPLVHAIKNYIHTHLTENFSVEDVAKATNFSKSLVSAVFKRETGQSIIAYAINEKLNEAKILIANGIALQQVAEQMGFSDYNYFSRLFKKKTLYTPMQYRKLLPTQ